MLKQLITNLYESANGTNATPEIHDQIDRLLEENDLTDKNKVPDWFIDFIKNIVDQKSVKRTSFKYNTSQGDISNFIAELEDLIDADWNDYGEAVEVTFPALSIYACISTEGNFYEVKNIKNDL